MHGKFAFLMFECFFFVDTFVTSSKHYLHMNGVEKKLRLTWMISSNSSTFRKTASDFDFHSISNFLEPILNLKSLLQKTITNIK